MGNSVYAIVFRNTGSTACSLKGWPKLVILGPRKLAAMPVHYGTETNNWVIEAATRVVLRPGASAAADVSVGYSANGVSCAYPAWRITPPHGQKGVTVPGASRYQPGYPQVCANTGYIVVSAMYPGHGPVTGYPSPAPSHLRHIYSTIPPA